MQDFVVTAIILLLLWITLAYAITESLRNRQKARFYRAKFVSSANDLVAKAEFPARHADLLISLAEIRPGWMARLLVVIKCKQMIVGSSNREVSLKFEDIPEQLRAQYVTSVLSYLLSDSYRSAFFGRAFRSFYDWMEDAIQDVKPDVRAHATRHVIHEVNAAQSRRFADIEFACA